MVLTRCTPLHFLGSRRKDIQDLDRNLHHFISHLRGQRDTSINLESSEETFNASEDVDENVLAPGNIFSCLRGFNSSRAFTRLNGASYQKEDAHASKDCFGGWECLPN